MADVCVLLFLFPCSLILLWGGGGGGGGGRRNDICIYVIYMYIYNYV